MELLIKKYTDLTEVELKGITELILKGDEVNPITLPDRLSEAAFIAFFKDKEVIAATATIKKPLDSYKTKVFTNSKSNLSIADYLFELGYVMVEDKYREHKLASRLCRELCKVFLSHKIFATTRVDNYAMQSILNKNYFIEVGVQYPNRENTNFLKIFIKQKIMDTYHINLGKAIFGTETVWSGNIMRMQKPTPGKRNTISMAESIGRNSKALAEGDIIREAERLDFENNEIIFVPTFERVTSLDSLREKLQEVIE